ncbi:hypothetical protein U0070_027089 [Myodes glareolus]|uniref:Uncharacterized protein n=1 Tax=Myodes glareolus TaxID=447135 RepID=A0AAW0H8Y1_MYOGA
MKYHSHPENLDEDGYTQLDFRTRDIHKRPKGLEKGRQASSPPWRPIVVALGILCLVAVVVASVLGVLGESSLKAKHLLTILIHFGLAFPVTRLKGPGSGRMAHHSFPTRFKSEIQLPRKAYCTIVYGFMGQRSTTKSVIFLHSVSVRSSYKFKDGDEEEIRM